MAALVLVGGGGAEPLRQAVPALPFAFGRAPAGTAEETLIPTSAVRVSRRAGRIIAGGDGRPVLLATHVSPLGRVRDGRLQPLWQQDAAGLPLRPGDIVVAEGWALLKHLNAARKPDPARGLQAEVPVPDAAVLPRFHSFRVEEADGAAAAAAGAAHAAGSQSTPATSQEEPTLTFGSQSQATPVDGSQSQSQTPACTPAQLQPPRRPDAAAAAAPRLANTLEAQLALARAELDRASADVVGLVVEALVARVASTNSAPAEPNAARAKSTRASSGPSEAPPRKKAKRTAGQGGQRTSAKELSAQTCGLLLESARARVGALAAAHDGLGTAALAERAVSTDRSTAQEQMKELQAALGSQTAHVLDVNSATKQAEAEAAQVVAQSQAAATQVVDCFAESALAAKERLHTLREKFATAEENGKPVWAKLKREVADELESAHDTYEEEPMKPDDWHCESCCDHSSRHNAQWGYRRGYYDDYGCEGGCAGEDCDCWEADAPLDFSVIQTSVAKLLKPIGTAKQPGEEIVSKSWETIVCRVKAVSAVLKEWADSSMAATRDDEFPQLCNAVGRSWQAVAVWLPDDTAAELGALSTLQQLTSVGSDGALAPSARAALALHRTALELLLVPWKSTALQRILAGHQDDGSLKETKEVSALRLDRLFAEDRHREALHLARKAGAKHEECKALIKVGSFCELADACAALSSGSPTSASIETLAGTAADDPAQAYLLWGYALLHKCKEPERKSATVLSLAFFKASVAVQSTGTTDATMLNGLSQDIKKCPWQMFTKAVALLRQAQDSADASAPVALFAGEIIGTLGSADNSAKQISLDEFVRKGGTAARTSHPRECFAIVHKIVAMQSSRPRAQPSNWRNSLNSSVGQYGQRVKTTDLMSLIELADNVAKAGDSSALEQAQKVCESLAASAGGSGASSWCHQALELAKHCGEKMHNAASAATFAKQAYASKVHLRPPQLTELISLMLKLGQSGQPELVQGLTHDALADRLGAADRTKLIQHLREARDSDPGALADLYLHELKKTKKIMSPDGMKAAEAAVATALKAPGSVHLTKTVAQIEMSVAASLRTQPQPAVQSRGYVNCATLSQQALATGKSRAQEAINSVKTTQDGLCRIASSLTSHRPLAAKLVSISQVTIANALNKSIVESMRAAWRAAMNAYTCRINHQQWSTMCQKCVRAIRPVLEATCTAVYLSSALSDEARTEVDGALAGMLATYKAKLKRPMLPEFQNLRATVNRAPLTATAVVFSGFKQPPEDVTKWLPDDDDASPSVPSLPADASLQTVGSWVGQRMTGLLGSTTCEKCEQKCSEELLDAEILCSMTDEDLSAVFELGCSELPSCSVCGVCSESPRTSRTSFASCSVRKWVAIRRLRIDIESSQAQTPPARQTIPWSSFLPTPGPASELLRAIDSAVVASLSDPELAALAPKLSDEPEFCNRLRALRNVFLHSAEPVSFPRGDLPTDPLTIVVIGGTGAGKSTLLNSVVGESELLPTNCMRACTATIIELCYRTSAAAGEVYETMIEFVSAEHWNTELDEMCKTISQAKAAAAKTAASSARSTGPADWLISGSAASDAVIKMRSVFGTAMEKHIMDADAETLKQHTQVVELLAQGSVRLCADSSEQLSTQLKEQIDSENETAHGAKWPLIKVVKMSGPWAALSAGVRLVDAPGLHDDNTARANVVKSYLAQADAILLVSNIKRAVNDKTTKDLMTLELRSRLASEGRLGQLSFVATQTDELVRSEIQDNLRLSSETTTIDCSLARNTFTKDKLTTDFWTGIAPALCPVNRVGDGFAFPVFTCSSIDFQKTSGIRTDDGPPKVFPTPAATELPALRGFIRAVAQQFSGDHADSSTPAWTKAGTMVLDVLSKKKDRANAAGDGAEGPTSAGSSSTLQQQLLAEHAAASSSGAAAASAAASGRDDSRAVGPAGSAGALSGVRSVLSSVAGLFGRDSGSASAKRPSSASAADTPGAAAAKRPRTSAAITPPSAAEVIDLCDSDDD